MSERSLPVRLAAEAQRCEVVDIDRFPEPDLTTTDRAKLAIDALGQQLLA